MIATLVSANPERGKAACTKMPEERNPNPFNGTRFVQQAVARYVFPPKRP